MAVKTLLQMEMVKDAMHRIVGAVLVVGVLCGGTGVASPIAGGSPDEQTALSRILGSRADAWTCSHPHCGVWKLDGRDVLSVTNAHSGTLTLLGAEQISRDVEYELIFRAAPPADNPEAGFSVLFQIGLDGPEDTDRYRPGCTVSGNPGTDMVTWQVARTNGWTNRGQYVLKTATTPSPSGPATRYNRAVYDTAQLSDLRGKWIALRYVVRNQSVETYLDDRLLDIRTGNEFPTTGSMRLSLSPNVALASLRVKPLPPDDPVYRPLSIGGFLNAATINGAAIDRASLPPADTLSVVGGVPFEFPGPDARGNDHISLAPSRAPFAAREGYFESMSGPDNFPGRWPTALTVNPARIQLRVPYASYTALHLIAAAGNEPDSVPVFTVQFFKGGAGFPENVEGRVPLFTAAPAPAVKLPVTLHGGGSGCLYRVSIPLDPGRLSKLGDLSILDLELTKEVHVYRSYPEPCCHSYHQGGPPSDVHVYALTLERSPVRTAFDPDKFGHVWTAPATPSYTVTLGNRTAKARTVELTLATRSHDGGDTTQQKQTVTVPPGDTNAVARFRISGLKRYGYHDVALTVKDGARTWVERRSLAYLPADTRERGNWEDGRGPILGYWSWGGAHHTPSQLQELQVMAEAGAETRHSGFPASTPPAAAEFARAHHFSGLSRFTGQGMYDLAFMGPNTGKWILKPAAGSPTASPGEGGENEGKATPYHVGDYSLIDTRLGKWNADKADASTAALLEELKHNVIPPGPLNRADLVGFFPEPSIGPSTYGNLPEYWGESEYTLTPDETEAFNDHLNRFLAGARLVRKHWPDTKLLLPYGDPLYVIPFLRYGEEVRRLIDGVALDMPGFTRIPEMQLHQATQHRLYQTVNEFRKYGKKPLLAMVEGPCVPTLPGTLTWDEQADLYTRSFLIYFAYGVDRHPSGPTPFDCGNYWGEEEYGACGLFTRLPQAAPKPSYVAYATLSRHLNRANFEKWLPTGSLSTYALRFKHHQTGKLIHVFWTIRGRRAVTVDAGFKIRDSGTGSGIVVYDEDDNPTELIAQDGKVTFTIDSSPCYVEGLTADPVITLGAPDHSDSRPTSLAVKLGNPGDGSWKIRTRRDLTYENNSPRQMARFLGNMSLVPCSAPEEQGGTALAVRLEKQDKERQLMPWYTCLVPKKPIEIPGKASHLGLWVNAASDWGRVVYCLRDAKDQRWISTGTRAQWHCDDTHQWSSFCFDGWRYLRFELPSNLPYDNFREMGSTWWGHYGPGDGIVALPLRLEKIIVERRTHAMYVNDPQPADKRDVLLADLIAEYERAPSVASPR